MRIKILAALLLLFIAAGCTGAVKPEKPPQQKTTTEELSTQQKVLPSETPIEDESEEIDTLAAELEDLENFMQDMNLEEPELSL